MPKKKKEPSFVQQVIISEKDICKYLNDNGWKIRPIYSANEISATYKDGNISLTLYKIFFSSSCYCWKIDEAKLYYNDVYCYSLDNLSFKFDNKNILRLNMTGENNNIYYKFYILEQKVNKLQQIVEVLISQK